MSCHVERLLLRSLQRSNKIRTRQEITATRANQLAAPFYQPRRTARTKNNGWFTGHKISARLGHQNYLRHCLWFRCLHGCKASLIAQTAMRAKPDEQEGIKRPRPKASRHGVHSWPGQGIPALWVACLALPPARQPSPSSSSRSHTSTAQGGYDVPVQFHRPVVLDWVWPLS
jgi:hypothetical protein